MRKKLLAMTAAGLIAFGAFGAFDTAEAAKPIAIQEQGSFAVGGSTVRHAGTFSTKNFLSPEGQTAYGDHAYVFYQIPAREEISDPKAKCPKPKLRLSPRSEQARRPFRSRTS